MNDLFYESEGIIKLYIAVGQWKLKIWPIIYLWNFFFSLDLLGLFLCKILPNGINDGVTVWLMPCQYVTEETWERERAPSKLRVPLLFCHLILIGESRLHRNYWNSLPWPLICPPSQCEENEGLKLIGRSRLTNSIRWGKLTFWANS